MRDTFMLDTAGATCYREVVLTDPRSSMTFEKKAARCEGAAPRVVARKCLRLELFYKI